MPNPARPPARNASTLVWVMVVFVVLALAIVWWQAKRSPTADRHSAQPVATTPSQATEPTVPTAGGPASHTGNSDFVAALDAARAIRDPRARSREFGQVLQRWLAQDPDAALAYVRTLPRSAPEFTQGLLAALEAIGRREPDRALQLAAELATTPEQRSFYSSFFAALAERDPASAAQKIEAVPAGSAKENAIRALGGAWARRDFGAAFAWADRQQGPERSAAVESVVAELVPTDPLRAIQLAQKSLEGAALERTLSAALQQLVKTDPKAAAAIVPLLPAGETQQFAAVEVAQALAARNPTEALLWASQLPAGSAVRTVATARALDVWAGTDPAAAGRYVLGLPAEVQRELAPSVGAALANADAPSAVAWAQTLADPETRATTLSHVVDTWARHDPAAASQWLVSASAEQLGGARAAALDGALAYWMLRDAVAPREFVATLPPERQTSAAQAIAPLLAQNNPAEAMRWALSLPNQAARESAVGAAYQRWADNAPSAAKAWLDTAPLAPETKARLGVKR